MELRHLRYFLVVAEEQHFTRAAIRLGMQQPPLSQQIKTLENQLGFDLFRRHPKGAELTPGGKAFLKEATAILASIEEATRRSLRAAQGTEGTLSVGFTTSAAAHPLIPAIIRAYQSHYPNVNLEIREGNAAELTDAVEARRVDVAFIRIPVRQPRGTMFLKLLEEEMLLILPSDHPLMRKRTKAELPSISLKSLSQEKFILVRRHGAPGMFENLLQACERLGFSPRIAMEVDRMLTNINLVASGAGISVVPASMKGFHSESVTYCRIRDAQPRLVAPITVMCRDHEITQLEKNFLLLAREFSR